MPSPTHPGLFARQALLPDGWASDVTITLSADGSIGSVSPGTAAKPEHRRIEDPLVPAMPNLHSHAFQFALAGLAERAGASRDDSFWTWRETMYGFLADLDPDGLEAVATELYRALRRHGYGWVGEFHYVHHQPDGTPYTDLAEMGRRLLRAAEVAGIGITLLPVFYEDGGFGGATPSPGQRRFLNDPDRFARLVETLAGDCRGRPDRRIGIAPHSLRAARPERLDAVLEAARAIDPDMPVHIHVAEQRREVEDCLSWCGKRPVRFLLDRFPVDRRWCLIHATHLIPDEIAGIAETGAVVGLCPTTEANLGDGLFPGEAFLDAGGRFGIGTDSHVSVDPVEELRWLEYGQRLATGRRTVLTDGPGSSVGTALWRRAADGGAQALAAPIGRIAPGFAADWLIVESRRGAGDESEPATGLDRVLFAPAAGSLAPHPPKRP